MLKNPTGLDLASLDKTDKYLLLHGKAETSDLIFEALPISDQIIRFNEINAGECNAGEYLKTCRGLALMRIGSVSPENQIDQVFALAAAGFATWNSAQSYIVNRDRIYATLWLKKHKIPVPRFIVPSFGHRLNSEIFQKLGDNFIVKVARGTKGYGVMKCSSVDELIAVVETFLVRHEHVMVQEYLEGYAEFRVLIVNDQVLGAYRKHDIGFRNNFHQDAQLTRYEPTPELEQVALAAHRASLLTYSGVDLMVRGDDIRVLEVNSSPGLVGFTQTDPELINRFASLVWQQFKLLGASE